MGKASRDKGARGEREFANLLKELGFTSLRKGFTQCAPEGESDVECKELPNWHFEVKRVNRLEIWRALAQAEADAKPKGRLPVVAFKRDRSEWYITMGAEELMKMVKGYLNTLESLDSLENELINAGLMSERD